MAGLSLSPAAKARAGPALLVLLAALGGGGVAPVVTALRGDGSRAAVVELTQEVRAAREEHRQALLKHEIRISVIERRADDLASNVKADDARISNLERSRHSDPTSPQP